LHIQHVYQEQAPGFIRYQLRGASTVVALGGGMKKARTVRFQGNGLLPVTYTAHHPSLVGSDHVLTPPCKIKKLSKINSLSLSQ
jgi:hypothetical protein